AADDHDRVAREGGEEAREARVEELRRGDLVRVGRVVSADGPAVLHGRPLHPARLDLLGAGRERLALEVERVVRLAEVDESEEGPARIDLLDQEVNLLVRVD